MIEKDLRKFGEQFNYEPRLQNEGDFAKAKNFILVGMGGSALGAGLLKAWQPETNIVVHRDYGLPPLPAAELEKSLIVLSSYSGNTEEVIDAFAVAGAKKLKRAVISAGGELLTLAEKESVPYIKLPAGIQPRLAVGSSFVALLKLAAEDKILEAAELAKTISPAEQEEEGKTLAQKLIGFVPVVYASRQFGPLAYAWKVVFNETGKIPAFSNVLPELNHNEMTGFDVRESTVPLSKNFQFLILQDGEEDERISKRAQTLKKLYRERDLNVQVLELRGNSRLEKIFNSYLLVNWAAYHLASHYGVEPEAVPMVEEFKKLISG